MNNKYRARTLFSGYKIGLSNPYWYVAVTEKALKHSCMVVFQGDPAEMRGYMVIKKGTEPVKKMRQKGVGSLPDHTLCYFVWKPYVKKEEIKDVMSGLISKLSPEQRAELRAKLGLKPEK